MDKNTVKRFWSKVDICSENECWEWVASKNSKGYGEFWFPDRKKHTRAHQVSWIIEHGNIPDGLGVLHKCDNPSCVNPRHLFLGTNSDNNKDRDAKGRRVQGKLYYGKEHPQHGTNSPHNKLTENQVFEIIKLKESGKLSNVKIAAMFGITNGYVNNIWRGRKWAWLTGR